MDIMHYDLTWQHDAIGVDLEYPFHLASSRAVYLGIWACIMESNRANCGMSGLRDTLPRIVLGEEGSRDDSLS